MRRECLKVSLHSLGTFPGVTSILYKCPEDGDMPMAEVLDFVHVGSSLSLRSFASLGSSLTVCGLARFGSSLAVLDFVQLGSSLSLRNYARLGSAVALLGMGRFGSVLSVLRVECIARQNLE